jgi:D-lactate dehydrogenase
MRIIFYSTKDFEKPYLEQKNIKDFELNFTQQSLSLETVSLAEDYDAISIFANDDASAPVISALQKLGVKYIAIRAAGYDNIDITAANEAEITVANVPDYSPHAIAEHTVLMMLALDRRLIQSDSQVKKQDFTLNKLIGFDLNKKKVGIIGTGKIGGLVAKILHGFGCIILAYDTVQDQHLMNKYDVHYVGLNTLCSMSDIITIHLPLKKETKHLINGSLLKQTKRGVMLINTARGGIVKTEDVLTALEDGCVGYFGMDVYEKEKDLFFYDHSDKKINDPVLLRLMQMPNVLITPHQAFATGDALSNIASTTFASLNSWAINDISDHELTYRKRSERLVP